MKIWHLCQEVFYVWNKIFIDSSVFSHYKYIIVQRNRLLIMKLIEIADIKIGYNYKRESSSRNDKDVQITIVPVLQPRNAQSLCLDNVSGLEQASIVDAKDKYFLSTDEILFSNKGDFKAFAWLGNKKVIASSAFYRIKLKNNSYLPAYVATYLNSSSGKSQLNLRQNTERVSTITISDVEQIDIPFIPLEKQKQIIELFLLYEKEVDIMEKIKQNRKKLINSILSQTIKE